MDKKITAQSLSNRFINYDINIACLCSRSSWGMLVKEQGTRAGFSNVELLYQGLDSLTVDHGFDLIFIDDNVDENSSGGEIIDSLLEQNIILPTTAVVVVTQDVIDFVQNYDSPLMLVEAISSQFTEKELVKTVQRLSKSLTIFKPTLTFISNGKFDFAYKSLQAIPKTHITIDIIQKYFKLMVNLAFEMGNYAQVVLICNKPNIKGQVWSLWAKLKANYELGNWGYCTTLLSDESFVSLAPGTMKLFWQLRILLQQQNFDDVLELVNAFPANKMPTSVVRLVFIILAFAGKFEDAQEFIKRKIRLSKTNSYLSGELTMSLCNMYFYEYWASNSDEKFVLMEDMERLFNNFKDKRIAKKFSLEVSLINTYRSITNLEFDPSQLNKIKTALLQISKLNNSPIINCRIAYAWHTVGEKDKAFAALADIDSYFSLMPLGSERLILGIVQTQVFNAIYDESQRFNAYKKIGEKHLEDEQYKLACKAFARGLEIKQDNDLKVKLLGAMEDAGIKQFSGYKFSPA